MSNIKDYLIEQTGQDWNSLLKAWIPPLSPKLTLWMVNRLGDIIAEFEDGSIHFLDVGAGQLTRIADDREDFAARLDRDDNADYWLAVSLVDDYVASGLTLADGQCYGYRIPPLLGGSYDIDNIEPTDLSVHYGMLGDLFQQTKDLPDGTKVSVSFAD